MESTLCLHCRPFRIPSAVRTKATSPHFSFKHSSLLLSDGVTFTSQLRRHNLLITPIIKQKAMSVRASANPMKAALQSFLNMSTKLTLGNVGYLKELETFQLPDERPSTKNVDKLKMKALWLLRSEKGDEAEELLKKELKKHKNDPEPAYNLEIALAEILICEKKYGEAHDHLNHLKHQLHPSTSSDGRIPLYKAITSTMLNDEPVTGKEWWDTLISEIVEGAVDIPIEDEED